MIATAGVFALSLWRSERPSDPLRPRYLPWRMILILSAFFFVMLLANLFSLFGLEPQNLLTRY